MGLIDRRVFFKIAGSGVAGYFASPLATFGQSALSTAPTYTSSSPSILGTAKNAIFVLLPGAPSQIDTFDLHVGAWTPADFAPTTINGIDWPAGLLPALANQLSQNRLSVIRGCQSSALVHPLVQTWTQIARSPTSATGSIAPNIGAIVAYEFESQRLPGQKLPGFVSLNGGGTLQGAGYFPGLYSPFDVVPAANGLTNLTNADGQTVFTSRYSALQALDGPLRNTPSPYGTPLEEMADYALSAHDMMYDPHGQQRVSFRYQRLAEVWQHQFR